MCVGIRVQVSVGCDAGHVSVLMFFFISVSCIHVIQACLASQRNSQKEGLWWELSVVRCVATKDVVSLRYSKQDCPFSFSLQPHNVFDEYAGVCVACYLCLCRKVFVMSMLVHSREQVV